MIQMVRVAILHMPYLTLGQSTKPDNANIEPCSRDDDRINFKSKSCPAKKPLPRQNCCPEKEVSI